MRLIAGITTAALSGLAAAATQQSADVFVFQSSSLHSSPEPPSIPKEVARHILLQRASAPPSLRCITMFRDANSPRRYRGNDTAVTCATSPAPSAPTPPLPTSRGSARARRPSLRSPRRRMPHNSSFSLRAPEPMTPAGCGRSWASMPPSQSRTLPRQRPTTT